MLNLCSLIFLHPFFSNKWIFIRFFPFTLKKKIGKLKFENLYWQPTLELRMKNIGQNHKHWIILANITSFEENVKVIWQNFPFLFPFFLWIISGFGLNHFQVGNIDTKKIELLLKLGNFLRLIIEIFGSKSQTLEKDLTICQKIKLLNYYFLCFPFFF